MSLPWPLESSGAPHEALYLQILAMALSFAITPIGRLMTFEAIVSRIRSITTTLATKI
jgi:hypothetical protein